MQGTGFAHVTATCRSKASVRCTRIVGQLKRACATWNPLTEKYSVVFGTSTCAGTEIDCNDGNPCTDDACVYGICSHTPNDSPGCGDGPCPGGCDDGDHCTVDSCDDGTCTNTPHGGPCDDGDSCTENDACSGVTCAGTPMYCDDGDPCTIDTCDGGAPLKDRCMNDPLCEEGECCNPPCEACQENGTLDGANAVIEVSPQPACLGDTITFTVSGVVDNGGIMRVDCTSKRAIDPVTPTYTWEITRPDGTTVSGSGSSASGASKLPGTYSCTFTAAAARQCAPDPLTLAPETATAIRAELNPVTSGTDPVPINPAIVAPLTPLLLDNGVLFWDANSFELTTLQPSIDLTTVPVTWTFNVTSGLLNPTAEVVVAPDQRSARLEIPFPSFGNLGEGRMEFRIHGDVCGDVETLIKNVQPDLEPGDFRFQVKAHLCTDGAGTSTTRTAAEVQTIMSDVTKVLSQCGIIVTTGQIAATQVNPGYLKLDSTAWFDMWFLFGTDYDDTAIDVYFIQAIDFVEEEGCGYTSGLTGTPEASGAAYEAGIAIPDGVCDGTGGGQEVVRTLAHEIVHYLLNHTDVDADHVENEPANLMSRGVSDQKRDLAETQCLEMRDNHGVD